MKNHQSKCFSFVWELDSKKNYSKDKQDGKNHQINREKCAFGVCQCHVVDGEKFGTNAPTNKKLNGNQTEHGRNAIDIWDLFTLNIRFVTV